MKIVFISDTHGQHRKLKNLPEADMIIHGGDLSKMGRDHEVQDFINWFSKLNYTYRIFIAGNHDFHLEDFSQEFIQKKLPQNCYFLCNSGIEIEGVKIWGSPVTPTFFNWAFNVDRGIPIQKYWKMIPSDTNILVTHGPVKGMLDRTTSNINAGCEDLLNTVNKVQPKFHLFGHIHEAYGKEKINETTFVNGSLLDEKYEMVHLPVEINID